jgi:hypothetical protein
MWPLSPGASSPLSWKWPPPSRSSTPLGLPQCVGGGIMFEIAPGGLVAPLDDRGGCPCYHLPLLDQRLPVYCHSSNSSCRRHMIASISCIPLVLSNNGQVVGFTVMGGFEEVHGKGHLQRLSNGGYSNI